jgi:hypothetical protein
VTTSTSCGSSYPPCTNHACQWLTNADDDARERADDAASSIADALPSQETEASAGDSDPLLAAEDALRDFAADEVVVVTRPDEEATWLEEGSSEMIARRLRGPEGHWPRRERQRLTAATRLPEDVSVVPEDRRTPTHRGRALRCRLETSHSCETTGTPFLRAFGHGLGTPLRARTAPPSFAARPLRGFLEPLLTNDSVSLEDVGHA